MRTKYLVSILVSVLIISGFVFARADKPVKMFKEATKVQAKKMAMGNSLRVIADRISRDEINLYKEKGCSIKHRMKEGVSFECPADVVSELKNAREARVFHVVDMEADQQIGADKVWAEGIDGTGVPVVILDTGIDSSHIELSDSILGQKDFVDNDDIAEDGYGHGTHVAGIITANGIYQIDGNYATGVAPGAGVYMLRVCDDSGNCLEDDMMAAMEYAVNELDAQIMSISIGGGNFGSHCDSDTLAAKVNWVADNGYVVMVSSGNDAGGVSSPACASKAVAVGAVDKDDIVAYWSNRGTALDIVAPGVDIFSTYSCQAAGDCSTYWYADMSGTSMSAPHVSGVAALLLETKPGATTQEIKDALYNTATPAAGCQTCRFYWNGRCYGERIVSCTSEDEGAGVVDAYGAYDYIKSLAPECVADDDCDDGLYCNGAETCDAGVCQAVADVDCSGMSDACNDGVCDEDTDSCVMQPKADGTLCEDGLFCNVGEACMCGICTGGSAYDCDDSNACTEDSCNEDLDVCESSPGPDGTICDDALYCTVDDTCLGGACLGSARDCSDTVDCTVDSCDENNDVCVNDPDDLFCADSSFCNGVEFCDLLLGCQQGLPVNCNDNNECTLDSCSENVSDCMNIPVADDTPCLGGICCAGGCGDAFCGDDSDCDDNDACTIDSCDDAGTCGASCSNAPITQCVNDDGCCPEGCDNSNDNDCEAAVKCWSAEYEYLRRSTSQYRKFCKCAEGTYGYQSYSYQRVRDTAYQYVDTGVYENWDVSSIYTFSPVYRVRCADGNWYYTNQDYFSG